MPANIEGAQLGEELELAVGQMVVDPVRHGPPVSALLVAINKPRQHHTSHGSTVPVLVAVVPDVACIVALVRAAVVALFIAQRVDGRRAIRRPNGHAPKSLLQRLQQLFAQARPRLDGEVRILRNVGYAVVVGDLAVEEISHEEGLREPHTTQLLERVDGFW